MKLFHKNNIIYISLIAIGFFWCGSSYLSQETELINQLGSNSMMGNIIAIGIGSFAMALGILLFSVLYKCRIDTRKLLILFLFICVILNILFWFIDNIVIKSLILVFTSIIGASGYGGGVSFCAAGQ